MSIYDRAEGMVDDDFQSVEVMGSGPYNVTIVFKNSMRRMYVLSTPMGALTLFGALVAKYTGVPKLD